MATSVFDFWRVQSIVGDRSLAVIGSNLGGWFMPRPPLPSRQAMENPMLDITLPLPYPQTPESARTLLRAYGKPLTPEQLKAKFEREGKTFSGWAEERGYTRQDVYRVVNGMVKAKRGKGHQIAVELGLKPAA